MKKMITGSIIFFYLIVLISSAGAQDKNGPEVAVLVRGPVASRGFPLIYPNALELWSGYYRYLENEVRVSFTRKDILLPNEWESLRCNIIEGFSPSKESFFYKDTEWAVLFQFPPDIAFDCVFINTFIIRLKYFLRDSSFKDPPLLPAILEIP
jgi:hypothetical protein